MAKTKSATKITPLGDRVLIQRVEAEETTKGGIILPDSAKEKPREGIVLAIGTGKHLSYQNAISTVIDDAMVAVDESQYASIKQYAADWQALGDSPSKDEVESYVLDRFDAPPFIQGSALLTNRGIRAVGGHAEIRFVRFASGSCDANQRVVCNEFDPFHARIESNGLRGIV